MNEIKVQAPGRICLFGEHQDYLGYPVIAAAINRYIFIKGRIYEQQKPQIPAKFQISTPDLKNSITRHIEIPEKNNWLKYLSKRDYIASGLNVAMKNDIYWQDPWKIDITGNIPINAGASSSSALVIAWIRFLFETNQKSISPTLLGQLGYNTEVAEFDESGGMMDHFASAFGKIVKVESKPSFTASYLAGNLKGIVLANSGKKKNTVDDLRRVKSNALSSFSKLKEAYPDFDPFTTPIEQLEPYFPSLSDAEARIGRGNLTNRDITQKALNLFETFKDSDDIDLYRELGRLIASHHKMLSENIGVSIPEIDEMVQVSMEHGAFGAKINGSGFGGTMFAFAPLNQTEVLEALKDLGYECWAVSVSEGAKVI
jgi:galactokinase